MSAKPVTSIGEFADTVSRLRDGWRMEETKELWFRGESEKYSTPLRPTLYRPKPDKATNSRFLPLKSTSDLLEIEKDLHEEFQRLAVQLCDYRVDPSDWEWDSYFLMQHHLAPTRLLDWSDGALMALHFAIRNKSKSDKDNAIVYVLEPYRMMERIDQTPELGAAKADWNKYIEEHPEENLLKDDWDNAYLPPYEGFTPVTPILLDFPHITRRVAAQRSRFMVFGTSPDWLAIKASKDDSPVSEICIDAGCAYKMRRDLRDLGVTESVIFPDLDGLGRELKQRWEDLR